ncbi:MAG: peptidase [Solirubrobacterales bacterium]|nr:peptidase [Solirubrobacterales bacterium]
MSRPLIGVTVSEIRRKQDAQLVPQGEPAQTEMTLGLSYMRAVERAGGLPVALSPLATMNVDPLLDRLAGLLLTGGPDLDPSCYGAQRHPQLGPTDRDVDMFELELCRKAYLRGMPLLAICRGAQVLNVARHGTLHQHLPDVNHGAVEHRQTEPGDSVTHLVRVAPDSTLAQTTGGGQVQVNSFHHQTIDRLGAGLRPVAWAADGLIEAVEALDERFLIGVQWHAETLVDQAEHLALFEQLVEAARTAERDSGEQEDSDARAI